METPDYDPLRVWTVPVPIGLGRTVDFCVMMYSNQVRLCMLSQVGLDPHRQLRVLLVLRNSPENPETVWDGLHLPMRTAYKTHPHSVFVCRCAI